MAKVKVNLKTVCATVVLADGHHAPFMDALRSVRKLALPARTFYWLNKISLVLEKEFEDYEEARRNLVLRIGDKVLVDGKDTGGYTVPPAKNAEFQKEMETLNAEVELPIDEGVKLVLPPNGVAEDWLLLMAHLDIFAEPAT